ncbi:hypothetical protein V1511DRAFT_282781 [Dipodascopsis uninucleata]
MYSYILVVFLFHNTMVTQTRSHLRPQEPARQNSPTPAVKETRKHEKKGKENELGDDEEMASQHHKTDNKKLKSTSAQSQETNKDVNEIIEEGSIYFFFRPKVDVDSAKSLTDIQRTYIVLSPFKLATSHKGDNTDNSSDCRLLLVPKKTLPGAGERFLSIVSKTGVNKKEIKEFLDQETYDTKTRGERHVGAARPVCQGVYVLVSDGKTNRLSYAITSPSETTEVENDIGIEPEGRYIVNVRNPEFPPPSTMSPLKDPKYSKEIMESFKGYRWIPLRPEHLDYENCQILFIGSRHKNDSPDDPIYSELMTLANEEDTTGSESIFSYLKRQNAMVKDWD